MTAVFKQLPCVEVIRETVDYDPATGLFFWRKIGVKQLDSRRAGKRAFVTYFNGYLKGTVRGVQLMAHRVAWKHYYEQDPQGEVDHINGNRLDNRIANLRVVTSLENKRNARRPNHNTSGCVGVSFRADKSRWRAFITLDNRSVHLGYFNDKDAAIDARKAAEARFGFHPNHGRAAL